MSSFIAPMVLLAMVVLLTGTLYRLLRVIKSPVRRHIPITPAPINRWGVLAFLTIETITFKTLFKASVWTWVFGWLFHLCLLLTLIVHLRFLTLTAPKLTLLLMPYTSYISYGLLTGLTGLLLRRVIVERVRYVSSPSDYLHVLLLICTAGTGVVMSTSGSVNVYEVTVFLQGLFIGKWMPLTTNGLLAAHLLGACVLFCLYPFSKLFHGPLLWFNPTRSRPGPPRS